MQCFVTMLLYQYLYIPYMAVLVRIITTACSKHLARMKWSFGANLKKTLLMFSYYKVITFTLMMTSRTKKNNLSRYNRTNLLCCTNIQLPSPYPPMPYLYQVCNTELTVEKSHWLMTCDYA